MSLEFQMIISTNSAVFQSSFFRNLKKNSATNGVVTIRPESVEFGDGGDVRATVDRIVREDATNRITFVVDDTTVEAFAERAPAVGDEVWLTLPESDIHVCRRTAATA
jgi:ABC-type sugar transport system ATPase subunit